MLQPRPPLEHARVVDAFEAASDCFLRTVRAVREWESPGLGEWTMRELVAHTLRAYTTIESYLVVPLGGDDAQVDATAYYRVAMAIPNVHTGVAERGREAGRALTEPVAQSEEIATRVLALVRETPADRLVEVISGRIGFTDYIATRTVELALHTLDIAAATGSEPAMPADVTLLCLELLLPLAEPAVLLRAVTGRGTLNVLG